MAQKPVSSPRTTRAVVAAAPTVVLDAREPCLHDIELEETFVVEQAVVRSAPPTPPHAALADVAPPPFDIEDIEPPFDPPDADDEVFQARRQTLELDAGDAVEDAAGPARSTSEPKSLRAPAISIHISWERNDARALLAAFASDARLVRTEITEARGGLEAAYKRFGKTASPDLLVLDTALGPHALMSEIDPLLLRLEPHTKVIVLGDGNDVALVRDLARRGIAYFLAPKPDDVIARICDMYAAADNARVIAVVGARGGAGASTVAQNLAWCIAERQGASTALVDLDLSFGVAGFDFEERGAQSMGVGFLAPDLVDDAFLDRACVKQTERLSVYAAPPSVAQPFDLEAASVKHVIARVRRTAAFVVLDVPHQWGPWVKSVLTAADEVMIVATPDLASLRNAKAIMEALKETRKGGTEPFYLLSMVGAAKGPEISGRDYTEAMGAKPIEQLEFDPALFGMSALKNRAVVAMAPRSKAATTFDALAWILTGRDPAPRGKAKDVLERTTTAPPLRSEAALSLEKIQRPEAFEPVLTTSAPKSESKPRRAAPGHHRSYASAQRGNSYRGAGKGNVRAFFTVAAVFVACALSVQSREAVDVLGHAAGVLH